MSTVSDTATLAEGLARYLSVIRRPSGAASSTETTRLVADRDAHRLCADRQTDIGVADTFVRDGGAETPVRIYTPARSGVPQPAIVYLHGGGFTTGSVECYDPVARGLAETTGAVVISVHYARLPESTPNAIVMQCLGVLGWLARMAGVLGIDPARMAIAGDSAGAFLATHVAARAASHTGLSLICQILCYGVYDLDPDRKSYGASGDPAISTAIIRSIIAVYNACETRDPVRTPAPLRLADLSAMPPAVLLNAELDPFLAEAQEYAAALRSAGVATIERTASGMCHGFLRGLAFSQPACAEMRWLGSAFRNHLTSDQD